MNIKYLNESFKKLYEEAIDHEPKARPFESELKDQLNDVLMRLQFRGATNIKEYEIAFQEAIENMVPDKSWWEVTDCNIFFTLFETRSPELTLEQILAELKPEYKGAVEENLEELLDADIDLNLDASGSSVGFLGGTAEGNTNEALEEKDLEEALQECLTKLTEASISDEDQKDSDLIRSMLAKINKRSNARFTPEEQAVLDKYGLERIAWGNERNLTKDRVPLDAPEDVKRARYHYSKSYNNGDASKINYADRARKIPTRRDNQVYGPEAGKLYRSPSNGYVNMHGFNHNLQDAERNYRNADMREPVLDMKNALRDRRWNKKYMDNAQSDYDQAIAKAKKAYDDAVRRAENDKEQATTGYHKKGFDRAQSDIDRLLKRKPKED